MIDILVPVLARPANVQPLVDSIRSNTKVPHRIVFLVHPDDRDELDAIYKVGMPKIRSTQHGYAYKINLGAKLSKAEFLFLGADDLRFHPDWDRAAIDCFYATGKPVIGTNDLGNATVMAGKHATHSLVHRSYLAQGTIDDSTRLLHEGYSHNWVDTEFIATAQARDCFVFAPDSKVEHLHPFWGKGKDDKVYLKGRKSYHQDRRLFQIRRRLWR